MLKNSGRLSGLIKTAKKLKNDELIDIILFGSAVRGKHAPGDYDICLVFRKKIDLNTVNKIETRFKTAGFNVHMSFLTADNFFSKPHSLVKTILLEGFSLITKKRVSGSYGLQSRTVFMYELKTMKPSEKVKFIYALKGRRGHAGVLQSIKERIEAPGIIIVPTSQESELHSLFEKWGIIYKRIKMLS